MARYKGFNGSVKVGAAVVGEIESFELEISYAELGANVMGSAWTDLELGQASASGSVSVIRDPANAGQAALDVGTKVTLHLFPEGDTTGRTDITGSFAILSVGTSVSVGDVVKDSYKIQNAGAVTFATVA